MTVKLTPETRKAKITCSITKEYSVTRRAKELAECFRDFCKEMEIGKSEMAISIVKG